VDQGIVMFDCLSQLIHLGGVGQGCQLCEKYSLVLVYPS